MRKAMKIGLISVFLAITTILVLAVMNEVCATGPKIVVEPPCPDPGYQQAQPATDEQVLEWIRAEQWKRAMADLVERIKSVGGL